MARLHREAPLSRDVNGYWVASRFDDVRAILLDHRRFSSAAMIGADRGPGGPSLPFPLITDDPPRHTTLRGLLAKAFTPAAMETMRPSIEQLASELADAIPRGEQVDIVAAMTTPLPVTVIARMMGVPEARRADFKRWSNAVLGIQSGPIDADRIRLLMELRAYFASLAEARRAAPGDDLVSALTKVARGRRDADRRPGGGVLHPADDRRQRDDHQPARQPPEPARRYAGRLECAARAIPASSRAPSRSRCGWTRRRKCVIRRATEDVTFGETTIPRPATR